MDFGKYISIDSIIERVFRRFRFTTEIDKGDVIEELFDLIDLIGVPMAFVEKTTDGNQALNNPSPITIDDYRGTLPVDFHTCIACRTFPLGITMTRSTDIFHISTYNLSDYVYNTATEYDIPAYQDTGNTHTVYSYRLNKDYIFTDMKTGMVEMKYLAFPADNDGYPMIPDEPRYIKAAVYHIGEYIAHGLWLQGKMSGEKYAVIERKHLFYMASAGSAARIPNADERQALVNQIVRMVPTMDDHIYGNKYVGVPQYLRNFKAR